MNGATVSGGLLNCKGSTNKYWKTETTSWDNHDQIGTFRFQFKPNYNGVPGYSIGVFAELSSAVDDKNVIVLYHQGGENSSLFRLLNKRKNK